MSGADGEGEKEDHLFDDLFQMLERKGATLKVVTSGEQNLTGVLASEPKRVGNRLIHQVLMNGGELLEVAIFDPEEKVNPKVLSRVTFGGYQKKGKYHNAKSVRETQAWQEVVADTPWMSRQKLEEGKTVVLKIQHPRTIYKSQPGLLLKAGRDDDAHTFAVSLIHWDNLEQPSKPINFPLTLPPTRWRANHETLYVALSLIDGVIHRWGWQWADEMPRKPTKKKLKRK